jgi:purine nucleosidase
MPQRILLDTDIGDNVDDVLALALICSSPEIELNAITTISGDGDTRARLAHSILESAGAPAGAVPVAPEGVEITIDTLRPGDVVPVMIGPMTNLARSIVRAPWIIQKFPRVVAMGGEFVHDYIDTNVRGDPEAAGIVYGCGARVDVIPWSIGDSARFGDDAIEELGLSARPLSQRLAREVHAWRNTDNGRQRGGIVRLHDPMAVMSLIRPELFEWKNGTVTVELFGEARGKTTFHEDATGKHRVAWRVDPLAAVAELMSRLK